MLDLNPTLPGRNIAKFIKEAGGTIVENLDDANEAQKIVLGQQHAMLHMAGGAALLACGFVLRKHLEEDSDDDDGVIIDINSAR